MATPKTTEYRGFDLTARPMPLTSGKWSTEVRIRRNNVIKPFSAGNTFDTEDEAIAHSLDFGRKIIDGKIPRFSGKNVLP